MLGEGQFLWEIRNENCVKFKVLSWVKNATFVLSGAGSKYIGEFQNSFEFCSMYTR